MRRTLLLLALACAVAAYNDTAPYNQTRRCFDTLLVATPDQVLAIENQRLLCPLWKLNTRHVHGAHLTAAAQLVLLVSYPHSPHLLAPYMLETYSPSTGALLSSTALHPAGGQLHLPDQLDMCATQSDVWVAAPGGSLLHFDRATGAARPVASRSHGPYVAASDRLWLACTDTAVYVAVPAANAVWQLSPVDGLLERVVARLQSPGALTVSGGRLYVVSGRPALAVHVFDTDGTARGALDVASATSAGTADVAPGTIRGMGVASPSGPMVVVAVDDARETVTAVRGPGAVATAQMQEVRYAQLVLADGRTVLVGGLALDYRTGALATDAASALVNAGNADRLAAALYSTDQERALVLVDEWGAVLRYTTMDHACPVSLASVLPPLAGVAPTLLHVDLDSDQTPLVYALDGGRMLVWRRQLASSTERVWPQYCPGGETVGQALGSESPVPGVCALCGPRLVCTMTKLEFPLPERIADLSLVRLAWTADHTGVVLFNGPYELYTLDLAASLAAPDVPDLDAEWVLRASAPDREARVLDPAYWDARQAYGDVYALRMAVGEAYVLGGRNFSDARRIQFADTTQLVGATLTLLPNADAQFSVDSVCMGFPPNMTRPDPPTLTASARRRVRSLLIAGALLTALLCPLATVLFLGGVCYRAQYAPKWLRDTRLWRRGEQAPAWSSLEESGGVAPDDDGCGVVCGSTAQAVCFFAFQWAPPCAAWITSMQERLYRPYGRRGRSGFGDATGAHEEALYTSTPTPASATDGFANNEEVAPSPLVDVHLNETPGSPTDAAADVPLNQ